VPGHPDVLAQLSFGTWRFLLPSNDPGRELLWNQAINFLTTDQVRREPSHSRSYP
jgi:hypothetical protein